MSLGNEEVVAASLRRKRKFILDVDLPSGLGTRMFCTSCKVSNKFDSNLPVENVLKNIAAHARTS